MLTDSASIVLFAIRSAVKLGQQARKAYVDSTRRREMVLPLVNFYSSAGHADALNYFRKKNRGKRHVDGYTLNGQTYEGSDVLNKLITKPTNKLTDDDKNLLETLHEKYATLDRAREGKLAWDKTKELVNAEEFESFFIIGQWCSGDDPTPSTLHRMAGTFIEIGIDYAINSPDISDKNSKKGRALHSFLTALDDIDLPETDLSGLPARLFVATLETVSENPELISGDLKIQQFIRVTTSALSTDAAEKIKEINNDNDLDAITKQEARLKVQDWSELVYRSTLTTGGRLILSDPAKFLSVKDAGHQALISSVSSSILHLILEDEGDLEGVFSREGLEIVMSAALKAVGEHPGILTDTGNNGIKMLISELVRELGNTANLLDRDIFPETVRMVLEKSSMNLELFWPDLAGNPKKNLMLTAAKTTLTILSRQPAANEQWKPHFTKNDLLSVTEAVLDELVESPGPLITKSGKLSGTLAKALSSTIDVLRKRATNRLSPSSGAEILRVVIKTIAMRKEFTRKLPNGQPIVSAAVDTVLSTIFSADLDEKASWQLMRMEVINGIIQLAMEKLALAALNQNSIVRLQECLDEQVVIARVRIFSMASMELCLDNKFAIT